MSRQLAAVSDWIAILLCELREWAATHKWCVIYSVPDFSGDWTGWHFPHYCKPPHTHRRTLKLSFQSCRRLSSRETRHLPRKSCRLTCSVCRCAVIMLNPQRSMSYAVASLRRLITTSRASQSGKVQIPSILASRGFCHRASLAKPLLASPIATARLVVSRGYATTTVKKPKRKTAAKKPKKKVAKKPKKRVAKKPAKLAKPKILKVPTKYGISGYSLFMQSTLASSTGPGINERFSGASAQWKALSDAEKEVYPIATVLSQPIPAISRWMLIIDLEISRPCRKCRS